MESPDLSTALADAIADLVDAAAGTRAKTVQVGRVRRTRGGGLRIQSEDAPSWSEALTSIAPLYWGLPSYSRAVGQLHQALNGREFQEVGNPARDLYRVFITTYLERVGAFAWEETIFAQLLAELKTFLEQAEHHVLYWVPLTSCRLARSVKEVKLSDAARIRASTNQDLEDLWNAWSPNSVSTVDLGFACLLEIKVPIDSESGGTPRMADARRLTSDIELALRLAGDCSVGAQIAWSRPDPEQGPFALAIAGNSLHRRLGSVSPGRELVIGKAIARKLPKLVERCQEAKSGAAFDFACRRFSFAFERTEIEDRVIDCWVAFEALFLPEMTGELSYRASMRIARFVGDSGAERRTLRKTLADSYQLRSYIAHGTDLTASKKAKKLKPAELTEKTLHILRRSLLRWTDPDAVRDPTDLDSALLA